MHKLKLFYIFLIIAFLLGLLLYFVNPVSVFFNDSDEGFDSCQQYDCACKLSRDKQFCEKKSCVVSYQVPPQGCGKVCADECKKQCQNKDIKSCESPSDKVEE